MDSLPKPNLNKIESANEEVEGLDVSEHEMDFRIEEDDRVPREQRIRVIGGLIIQVRAFEIDEPLELEPTAYRSKTRLLAHLETLNTLTTQEQTEEVVEANLQAAEKELEEAKNRVRLAQAAKDKQITNTRKYRDCQERALVLSRVEEGQRNFRNYRNERDQLEQDAAELAQAAEVARQATAAARQATAAARQAEAVAERLAAVARQNLGLKNAQIGQTVAKMRRDLHFASGDN